MKGILLIVDGLGDLPVPALDGRTPLEAAHTPVMDALASAGRYGLVDPIQPGETPNTHSGAGQLLGLDPGQADFLKRGPVEAAGLDMPLAVGDIALRANFATVKETENGLLIVDRRAGRIAEGAAELAKSLDGMELGHGVTVRLRSTEQHRCVLVLSGPGLEAEVSDTDPGNRRMPALSPPCRALDPAAQFTARVVNRFVHSAHRLLDRHPLNASRKAAGLMAANGIITRGAGKARPIDNVIHALGLGASVVTGCNTVGGLGRLFGFDVVRKSGFTGNMDTDLEGKIESALAELRGHDLVFVHVKAPDVCAHDLQPLAKRDVLQRLDTALEPLLGMDIKVAVAADHTTNSNTGFHTADPVPALLSLPGASSILPVKFGECACRTGNLGRQTSHQFLLEFIRAGFSGP